MCVEVNVCKCVCVINVWERRRRYRGFGLLCGITAHREERRREHRDGRRERKSLKKGSGGDRRQETEADTQSKPHRKNAQF